MEVDDPLRSEFRRAAVEQSFGLPFRDAMLNLRSRVPVADLAVPGRGDSCPKGNRR